ncbi:DUF5954 family protein [Streptacidiphilus sp. P02-A3a]|uniref:DUF5954 family protein n=1 Tax=Streptacidiphilus sp. P02-A3a TaxID=2704468 RepID=UPI0015F7E8C7|nr:DUF5954 family protein [Streptacidiphilus sp. P02-A3a]QMU71120.1 PE-PGRS family protein [Streptacidiphilus sp. P02-A3a]
MPDQSDSVPAYRTIRMTAPPEPEAARADADAWRAREAYPEILGARRPVFGVARERDAGGWELQGNVSAGAPQECRDDLAATFRGLAREAGDQAAHDEYTAAAVRLDWEPLNEMTVRGSRYRVVRAEQFIRLGPTGPEPPRPSDPDPAPVGESHRFPDPVDGFVVDPFTATGMSEGILKHELLCMVWEEGSVPDRVWIDSRRAVRSHPGGVLLPATFMMAELLQGRWSPSAGASSSPQGARDVLALDLRVVAPIVRKLSGRERERYARAADRLDRERGVELRVGERRFRLVRVERLMRIGPDGPEGPRRSDHDPQPPVMVHDQQLKAQGIDHDQEQPPREPGPAERDMIALFQREDARREALRRQRE